MNSSKGRYGQNKTKNIPVHRIADILGVDKSSALLNTHILTGRDVTSKVGCETTIFKAEPEIYLKQRTQLQMIFSSRQRNNSSKRSAEGYK